MQSTQKFSERINRLKYELQNSDAILIGAGSGLSTSAGLTYNGKRFYKYFADFHAKYGIKDMYSGGFYPFKTLEEYWAWWARHVYYNRYVEPPKPLYKELYELVKDKNYFVLTTNVDHCFQRAGFDKKRLFYTQGDYGLFQCSVHCHNKTYDNENVIRRMVAEQKNMKIPSELIPYCPVCGKPMTVNLRCDETFVEDDGWKAGYERYKFFLENNKDKKILLLELGVGMNTPAIIKYPFLQMALNNENATYVCVNKEASNICKEQKRIIYVEEDIGLVVKEISENKNAL